MADNGKMLLIPCRSMLFKEAEHFSRLLDSRGCSSLRRSSLVVVTPVDHSLSLHRIAQKSLVQLPCTQQEWADMDTQDAIGLIHKTVANRHHIGSVFSASACPKDRKLAVALAEALQVPLIGDAVLQGNYKHGQLPNHYDVVTIALTSQGTLHILCVSRVDCQDDRKGAIVVDVLINAVDVAFNVRETIQSLNITGPGIYHVVLESNSVLAISNWEGVSALLAFHEITGIDFLSLRAQLTTSEAGHLLNEPKRCTRGTLRFYGTETQIMLERADHVSQRMQLAPSIGWVIDPVCRQEMAVGLEAAFIGANSGHVWASVLATGAPSWINEIEEDRRLFPLPLTTANVELNNVLAIVDGGFRYDWRRNYLAAAASMGIELVVIDNPTHWMADLSKWNADEPHLNILRFCPVDMTDDATLHERIVCAVQSSGIKVHGICTFRDEKLVAVAKAAELLELPTSPPAAFLRCVDKALTREICPVQGRPSYTIDSREDLDSLLVDGLVEFPCIVKPRSGGGSHGVFKVHSADDLVATWDAALSPMLRQMQTGAILEPFVDGPEVDVNVVLQDGELLFCEIGDQIPFSGDPSTERTFLETAMLYPSVLVPEKQQILAHVVADSVRRMGFRTGMFHAEARLDSHNGNSVAIIEVNARAPGFFIPELVAKIHGVDHVSTCFLAALGRDLKNVTRSFSTPTCWVRVATISAPQDGIFGEEDMYKAIRSESSLLSCQQFFGKGQRVPPAQPGTLIYLGRVEVMSSESAEHATRELTRLLSQIRVSFV